VTVRESRPISKTKHWVLERIDERAAVELPRIEA
jgi:ribosomal protein S17